jgi:sulfur carrier protein
MQIQLNGQPYPLEAPLTLSDLLAALGLSGKPVVAELNEEAILPRNFPGTRLTDKDRVEIITLAAGG